MKFKIAFIGAGSLIFTRTLFTDIMSVPEFRDIDIAFTDISEDNLKKVTDLCQRDLEANGIATKIQSTLDRREAFQDARYIINCVRIGGLEGFETDIEIPLKYGVDQCVGDTLCIGGIMYGQRVIAAMLDFCKDIREVAAPGAVMLNYSNPNAMATWACNKYGKVKTIGLCHGEIHGEQQIAEVLGIPRDELDFVCAGINHQTWYISISHHGESMLQKLLPAFEAHETYREEEKVRIDILKRFGYYSTESNGHLSEYVAWYRKRPDEIKDWIDLSRWIHGETGGYLRVTREECARLIKKQREVFGSGYRKKPQNMTRTAALRFRNTQKRSRANKNRIQPTGTPRTRNVSPGRFLFENLSFSQVKSRRK